MGSSPLQYSVTTLYRYQWVRTSLESRWLLRPYGAHLPGMDRKPPLWQGGNTLAEGAPWEEWTRPWARWPHRQTGLNGLPGPSRQTGAWLLKQGSVKMNHHLGFSTRVAVPPWQQQTGSDSSRPGIASSFFAWPSIASVVQERTGPTVRSESCRLQSVQRTGWTLQNRSCRVLSAGDSRAGDSH